MKAYFPVSGQLEEQIKALTKRFDEEPDSAQVRAALIQVINDLTTEGMDYYFEHSLSIIKVGFMTSKAVAAVLSTSKSTVRLLTRRYVKDFSAEQTRETIRFILDFVAE